MVRETGGKCMPKWRLSEGTKRIVELGGIGFQKSERPARERSEWNKGI